MTWPGAEFLRELDRWGQVPPAFAQVLDAGAVTQLLLGRGLDPRLVAERELAAAVGDELWVPLFSVRLRPIGLACMPAHGRPPCLFPGWAMDAGALRILSGRATTPAELWVVQDVWDWLSLATHWSEADEVEHGVVGIARMPWPDELGRRVPDGTRVVVTSEQTGARVLASVQDRDVAVRLWRPARAG